MKRAIEMTIIYNLVSVGDLLSFGCRVTMMYR